VPGAAFGLLGRAFRSIEERHMETVQSDRMRTDGQVKEVVTEVCEDRWIHWPVNWTSVWIGALAAFCVALLMGLIGIALGAHLLGPEDRIVELRKLSIGALIFSVCGAFFAFALGGWVAGKIAGIRHSEPAMLHGAITWLVGTPLLVAAAALGAGSFFGGWYAGLAGRPAGATAASAPFTRPDPLSPGASAEEVAAFRALQAEYDRKLKQWEADTPKVTRNSALGALTALLLGLVGSVIGGWMSSGEPMNFSHYKTRKAVYYPVSSRM
jgi:uncharacterized membrane protein YeaQ/YmgE (transglycosylase-associated protein family)